MRGVLVMTVTMSAEPGGDDDCEQVEFLAAVRRALETSPEFIERYGDRLVGFVVPQAMNANSDTYRSAWRVPKAVTTS